MSRINSQSYRETEARFGAPMRDILVVLLSRMNREDAAAVLGCNPNTLDRWLAANALSFGRAYVVRSIGSGAVAPAPVPAVVAAIVAKAQPEAVPA